ncbi:MAG: urease accessory UreF family protein [Azospirillaceae bacterium]
MPADPRTATATITRMTMAEAETVAAGQGDAALWRLMAWLSPSYPVGAFSYSHGLEHLVTEGRVTDAAGLRAFVEAWLAAGGGRVDSVLFAAAHSAVVTGNETTLDEVIALAAAFRATAETAAESLDQGAAFARTTVAAWPSPALEAAIARHGRAGLAYPVAVALAAAGTVPARPALIAYLHAGAANLVSAGVRLIPLGQTDGQRVTAALEPAAVAAADAALAMAAEGSGALDRLGTAAPVLELASIHHERDYTRLFRS